MAAAGGRNVEGLPTPRQNGHDQLAADLDSSSAAPPKKKSRRRKPTATAVAAPVPSTPGAVVATAPAVAPASSLPPPTSMDVDPPPAPSYYSPLPAGPAPPAPNPAYVEHPDSDDPSQPASSSSTKRKRPSVSSYWSATDKASFLRGLAAHGKDWNAVSEATGGIKSPVQVRNYFQSNADALGLEDIALAASGSGRPQAYHERAPSSVSLSSHLHLLLLSFLFRQKLTERASRLQLVPVHGAQQVVPSPLPVLIEEPRPRSRGGMDILSLLNTPQKPSSSSSSSSTSTSTSRPPPPHSPPILRPLSATSHLSQTDLPQPYSGPVGGGSPWHDARLPHHLAASSRSTSSPFPHAQAYYPPSSSGPSASSSAPPLPSQAFPARPSSAGPSSSAAVPPPPPSSAAYSPSFDYDRPPPHHSQPNHLHQRPPQSQSQPHQPHHSLLLPPHRFGPPAPPQQQPELYPRAWNSSSRPAQK